MKIKRSRFVIIQVFDEVLVDLKAFFNGELVSKRCPSPRALSPLSREWVVLDTRRMELLARCPEEWIELSGVAAGEEDRAAVDLLVADGFLLSDSDDEEHRKMRRLFESSILRLWSPEAFFFHWSNYWREGLLAEQEKPEEDFEIRLSRAAEDAKTFIREHGSPPPLFVSRSEQCIELPRIEAPKDENTRIFEVLRRRRTVRSFDASASISLEKLSVLLRYVFGCFGIHDLGGEFQSLHKTSPSGGSLHPIEAYPIITRVEGVDRGLYHYSVEAHGLEPIGDLPREDPEGFLVGLAQSQTFVANAHLLVVLVARLERNFWKYSDRANTYNVLMKDAGHLSQTFYLVSTALGLGTFYTGAVFPQQIEAALGLDSGLEIPIGICGCGVPLDPDPSALPSREFVPRRSGD